MTKGGQGSTILGLTPEQRLQYERQRKEWEIKREEERKIEESIKRENEKKKEDERRDNDQETTFGFAILILQQYWEKK